METTTLRPGLLVICRTALTGNVHYERTVLESAALDEEGSETETWQTKRRVADAAELKRGKMAVSKINTIMRAVCAWSAFGLLCPESDEAELQQAIRDARAVADEFNATAQLSRLSVFVITGKVAADDVEAIKAINAEVSKLMTVMSKGIEKADVKSIRDAAQKAKELGQMLTPEAQGRVQVAIEAARKAASAIKKAGESAAVEVDRMAIRKITDMRTSFLDMDEAQEIAKPQEQGRAVDLTALDTGEAIEANWAAQDARKVEVD